MPSECRAFVVIGIVGLAAVVLLVRVLHNRLHGRSGGDNGPGGSAAQVPSKVQRLWCVSPRLLRLVCALDDIRSGRGLRRRGAWIKLLASLSLRPGRTAVVAVVGNDQAVARCLRFCTLPGGALVARRGGVVYAAVRLSGSVHVADVEHWVRRRLAHALPTAGVGSAETSWNGESVLSSLAAAKSAAMVDAIRAMECCASRN